MNEDERVTNLITKFMEAASNVAHVEVTKVYHITSQLSSAKTLEERASVYERETELIKYLKKLGVDVSLDFRVIQP